MTFAGGDDRVSDKTFPADYEGGTIETWVPIDGYEGLYEVKLMEKLKPCPFCGGEGCLQEHVFHGYASTYGVVCLDCCAETRQFFETKNEAVEAWNRRENESATENL